MSLADKMLKLEQDQGTAKSIEKARKDAARDKIVSAAFNKVAKREDELAHMLLNEDKFKVRLSEFNEGSDWEFTARMMGAKISDKEIVVGIDVACVEKNESFLSLVKMFEDVGYRLENIKIQSDHFKLTSEVKTRYFVADISPI
jgi:hypothetical protein